MKDQEKEFSRGEFAAAFSGPAIAANRFFVTVGPGGIRIAFTEQWSDDTLPEFRCAAMLPIEDAIELKDLLERLLRPLEAQIAKSRADGEPENVP